MTLGPEYTDAQGTWRDVRSWEPGDEMPKGYQYARKPGKWTNGRTNAGCIIVGVPYRIPVEKMGPSWGDVLEACNDCDAVRDFSTIHDKYIKFAVASPEQALRLIQAVDEPADPPKPEVPKMSLGPAYEHGGKWWQDVSNPDLTAPKPPGTQYQAAPGDWLDICTAGSLFYKDHNYRVPAVAPQTPLEAPASVPPALPMPLVPPSPEPPVGSVVLVGRRRQAYQRSEMGWYPAGGIAAHGWHHLRLGNTTVLLIYVPPEPAL